MGPWPSWIRRRPSIVEEKEKAGDPGFKSPRARHLSGVDEQKSNSI